MKCLYLQQYTIIEIPSYQLIIFKIQHLNNGLSKKLHAVEYTVD